MAEFGSIVFQSDLDLAGKTLVQASAGTGKTFNIQNAYLRLVVAGGLPVDRLLVVTFTEAATHELRERLRAILTKCRARLDGLLPEDDPDVARVDAVLALPLEAGGPADAPAARSARVRLALMDFDNAAVSTIHGFCKRILDRYAFECGHDPDAELLAEQDEIVSEICRDWWRKRMYRSSPTLPGCALQGPDELRDLVLACLARPDAELRPRPPTEKAAGEAWRRAAEAVREFIESRAGSGGLSGVEPLASARAFEEALAELSEALAARPPDPGSVREILDGIRVLAADAEWKASPEFPEAVGALQAACRAVWDELGSLAGSMAWASGGTIRKGKGPASAGGADPRGVWKARAVHGVAVRSWLDDPAVSWKATGPARAFIEGLGGLLALADDPPASGDARDFCRLIQALARTDCGQVIETRKRTVAELCPALPPALESLRRALAGGIVFEVEELAERVRAAIRERRALTYDGMLENVRRALDDADSGPGLAARLREEFRAALIDEFQDTDPVQYAVFKRLFADAGIPLLFVGDPKQAIYGFRGGDVFTYYRVMRGVPADRQHTLGRNYRSERNLVSAVNELFLDRGPERRSFVNENIEYAVPLEANDVSEDRQLRAEGRLDERPFRMWRYVLDSGSVPGKTHPAAQRIYADVAVEVVRLLSDEGLKRGGRRVRPSDIAILVADHLEAGYIAKELGARRVNAVRQSTGNVFDCAEAREVALLMQAMLNPGQAVTVRSALATSLVPCSRAELRRYGPEAGAPAGGQPGSLEDWMECFKEAGARWERRSFIEGFRCLIGSLGLKAHLAGAEDGERKLTDVLHLAELAHQAARERQLGPTALLRWFSRQLDPEGREADDSQKTRRASDNDAVRIMTVFTSKGLEFPIVFVPTLWRRDAGQFRADEPAALYHDGDQMVLDLERGGEEARSRVRREKLEEGLRLVYVAVTRAVNRTYLVSVTAGDPDRHPLARLVDAWLESRDTAVASNILLEERPAGERAEASVAAWAGDETPPPPESLLTKGERDCLAPRVDRRHGHASFSSLTPNAEKKPGLALRDVDPVDDRAEPAEAGPEATGIFAIPGGARTGNCWHAIFETLDFQAEPAAVRSAVDAELDRFHICVAPTPELVRQKRQAVHDMVDLVLATPLSGEGDGFALNRIPLSARRSELAFHFSLKQRGVQQAAGVMGRLLDEHWSGPARNEGFIADLSRSAAVLPLGFMTGFIDLVFCRGGRFYIVDWKSNRLGGRIGDFEPGGLAREMTAHAYYLQYLIYTVAVHGFLGRVLEGYDYDRHFGGVFYVFLRGVNGTPGQGVFRDRPSRGLVEALSGALARGMNPGAGEPA